MKKLQKRFNGEKAQNAGDLVLTNNWFISIKKLTKPIQRFFNSRFKNLIREQFEQSFKRGDNNLQESPVWIKRCKLATSTRIL